MHSPVAASPDAADAAPLSPATKVHAYAAVRQMLRDLLNSSRDSVLVRSSAALNTHVVVSVDFGRCVVPSSTHLGDASPLTQSQLDSNSCAVGRLFGSLTNKLVIRFRACMLMAFHPSPLKPQCSDSIFICTTSSVARPGKARHYVSITSN